NDFGNRCDDDECEKLFDHWWSPLKRAACECSSRSRLELSVRGIAFADRLNRLRSERVRSLLSPQSPVGLRGLEPLTSSLSGMRSSGRRHRPASRCCAAGRALLGGATAEYPIAEAAPKPQTGVPDGRQRGQWRSSASVTSMPPSSDADML